LGLALVAAVALAACAGLYLGAEMWKGYESSRLATDLEGRMAADRLSAEDKDQIEARLEELQNRDPARAHGARTLYLDKLLQIGNPVQTQLATPDLERLQRVVVTLAGASPRSAPLLQRQDRWERFQQLAAPYTHSTSLYFLLRPDPLRIANLEKVVKIQRLLAPPGAAVGPEFELMRAHFVEGNLDQARAIAAKLLAEDSLSLAWRMNILRDYVWLAAQQGGPKSLTDAQEQVEKGLAIGRGGPPAYQSLLVERARLLAIAQLYDQAERALEEYFGLMQTGQLVLRFHEEMEPDLQGSNDPRDNVPGLFFLEASLLSGFLREHRGDAKGARAAWEFGFQSTRRSRVGAYYEAAVLGSLCQQITLKDVSVMIGHTEKGARAQGPAPIATWLYEELTKTVLNPRLYTALLNVPAVLNQSWVSDRGKDWARRIAFRQLSLKEFTTIQVRL
jgi:hypothetical protein